MSPLLLIFGVLIVGLVVGGLTYVLLSGPRQPTLLNPFESRLPKSRHVVLIGVDVSTSMRGKVRPFLAAWARFVAEQRSNPDTLFRLYSVGGEVTSLHDGLVPAEALPIWSEEEYLALIHHGTSLHSFLMRASRRVLGWYSFGYTGSTTVLLFTDGEPTDSEWSKSASELVGKLRREHDVQYRVYAFVCSSRVTRSLLTFAEGVELTCSMESATGKAQGEVVVIGGEGADDERSIAAALEDASQILSPKFRMSDGLDQPNA